MPGPKAKPSYFLSHPEARARSDWPDWWDAYNSPSLIRQVSECLTNTATWALHKVRQARHAPTSAATQHVVWRGLVRSESVSLGCETTHNRAPLLMRLRARAKQAGRVPSDAVGKLYNRHYASGCAGRSRARQRYQVATLRYGRQRSPRASTCAADGSWISVWVVRRF